MKRKTKQIVFSILGLLVVLAAIFGYFMWKFTQGSEEITGKRDAIPNKKIAIDSIVKGKSDWNCWQGSNFDKKSAYVGLKKDWTKGLTKAWEVNFLCQDNQTASWAAPVIQGNLLIVPGRNKNSDLVFCLNAESGELIWKGSYEAETKTNHGHGARATPFIDNDRVYTFGRNGDLVCWNLKNGEIIWHKKIADIGAEEPDWGHSSSPLVFENMVIVQAGGKALTVAFNKLTGELLWKSGTGKAGYAPPTVFKNGASTSILLFSGEALLALNPTDGKLKWSIPWIVDYCVNASMPVYQENLIFITSGYGKGCATIKVDDDHAKILWQSKAIEGQHSDPVIVDGFVYGYSGNSTTNNGDLVCLNLADGKEMWRSPKVGTGTMMYADGHLICLDLKGNVFLVKVNSAKFEKVGEIKAAISNVKHQAWTAPVIANGKLYLRYLQQLICFKLE